MHWLITGGTGFIGSSLADYLHREGHRITLLSRRLIVPHAFKTLPYPDSLYDLSTLIQAERPDFIFHAAGPSDVSLSWIQPAVDFFDSVVLWQTLLESTRLSGLKPKIFFASSAAVYGNPDRLPVSEDAIRRPISPYGFHKLLCEQLAKEYAFLWETPVVILRLFSLIGPRQNRLLVWELFQQMASEEDVIRLQGTGFEERDYLWIGDLCKAVNGLSELSLDGFHLFNVGSGISFQIIDLASMIQGLMGTQKPIVPSAELRNGDPLRWRSDNSRLVAALPGWTPRDLKESLSECIESWKP